MAQKRRKTMLLNRETVLAAERRGEILARLRARRRVVVAELVAGLSVSEDTVRRDLQELAALGLLRRVHGGALASTPGALPFEQRREIAPEKKAALAEAAVPLVESSRTLFVDGGTTALEVARRLPSSWDGVVVTNAPPVADVLATHPNAEVVVVGGRLLKHAQVAVGPVAVDSLRTVRADACVLGVCAFHPETGVSTDDEEAHVKRAMVEASADVIALATRDKLHSRTHSRRPARELDHLVEAAGDDELLEPFRAAGVTVARMSRRWRRSDVLRQRGGDRHLGGAHPVDAGAFRHLEGTLGLCLLCMAAAALSRCR